MFGKKRQPSHEGKQAKAVLITLAVYFLICGLALFGAGWVGWKLLAFLLLP